MCSRLSRLVPWAAIGRSLQKKIEGWDESVSGDDEEEKDPDV